MIGKLAILLTCTLSLSSAFFFSKDPEWNGLRVTFGINPFNSNNFNSLPRTEDDARYNGWTKISDCNDEQAFRGVRYIREGDYAVVLLFDINGYIAGIQTGIKRTKQYPAEKQIGKIFQKDGSHYMLTAYYVDPATICTKGRSKEEYEDQGTGTALYIQNGPDPVLDSLKMPAKESDLSNTKWTRGHCFYTMGVHYWYNVSEDMSCDDFYPVFLLYNKEKLNAFGWAVGTGEVSPRFEHPSKSVISKFMNPVPNCLLNFEKLSTMHIYLTAHPIFDLC